MAIEVCIKKKFPDFRLDVNFQAGEEVFGVLGESGCGKSLTLKCIAGIETPDEGRIVLNGRVLFDSEKGINLPVGERKVGYLFQEYALFPNMTVEENIALGAQAWWKNKKAGISEETGKQRKYVIQERVEQYIRRFFLNGLEKKYPYALSGGQKQRVAIARMMITEPDIILLDEPFSAIDSYLKWQIEQQILDWLEQVHVTTLLVSHNRDEIYRLCERIGIIHEGSIQVCGTMKEIFHNPVTVAAAILTGCKNIADVGGRSRTDEREQAGEPGQDVHSRTEHTVYITAWNCKLQAPAHMDVDSVQSVGVRAHDVQMRLVKPDEEMQEIRKDYGADMEAVIERRIEAPFDHIYVVRPQGKETGTIRVEIPKSENRVFKAGDKVLMTLPENKLLWLAKE